jgi:hypothetical protein
MTGSTRNAAANIFISAISLCGALLFAVLLWNDVFQRLAENNRAPIGRVLRTARLVQRQLSRRTIWERAIADLPLYPGDKIRTGDESAVRISFESGDVIDLGSNSIITVEITRENVGLITLESGIVVPVVASGGMALRTAGGETKPLDEGEVYTAEEETAGVAEAGSEDTGPGAPALPETIFEAANAEEEAPPLVEAEDFLSQPENLFPQGTIGRAELAAGQGVIFSWNPVPGAERYEFILRTADGGLLWREAAAATARHVSDLSLFLANRSLVWSVQALGEGEIRSNTATASLTVFLPPIDAPQLGRLELH